MPQEEGSPDKQNAFLSRIVNGASGLVSGISDTLAWLPRANLLVHRDSRGASQSMEHQEAHKDHSSPKIRPTLRGWQPTGNASQPIHIDDDKSENPSQGVRNKLRPLLTELKDNEKKLKASGRITHHSPFILGQNTMKQAGGPSSGRGRAGRQGFGVYDTDARPARRSATQDPSRAGPSRTAIDRSRAPLGNGHAPSPGGPTFSPYRISTPPNTSHGRNQPSSSDLRTPSRSPDKMDWANHPYSQMYGRHPTSSGHRSYQPGSSRSPTRPPQALIRERSGSTPGDSIVVDGDNAPASHTRSRSHVPPADGHFGPNGRTGGAFGSPTKPAWDGGHTRPGRLRQRDSPVKFAQSTPTPKPRNFSDIEEVEETVESPNGPFREDLSKDGIEYIGTPAAAERSMTKATSTGQERELSPVKQAGDNRCHARLRPMKPKGVGAVEIPQGASDKSSPLMRAKTKGGANSPITSSSVKCLASIEAAHLLGLGVPLPIGIVGHHNGFLRFAAGTGRPPEQDLDIETEHLTAVWTSSEGSKPFLKVSIIGRGLARFIEHFKLHCPETQDEAQVLILFKEDSKEGKVFLETIEAHLPNVQKQDDQASKSILDSVPADKARRCKQPRRSSEGLDRRNEHVAENKPRRRAKSPTQLERPYKEDDDSDSPQVVRKQAKGKGKAKDPNQTTLDFTSAQRASVSPAMVPEQLRRSRRQQTLGTRQVESLEESDEEGIAATQSKNSERVLSAQERLQILFPYPPEGRADLAITKGDKHRVTSGDFLNDTLLEFGLRFVVDRLADKDARLKNRIHMFNSFFYDKLTNKKSKFAGADQPWEGYMSVRKWTKNQSIFEKEFVIVPINENFHWYLAVIYNPKGILRPPSREVSAAAKGAEASEVTEMVEAQGSESRTDSDAADLENLTSPTPEAVEPIKEVTAKIASPPAQIAIIDVDDDDDVGNETRESIDPLTMKDDSMDREVRGVRTMERGVRELSLNGKSPKETSNAARPADNDSGYEPNGYIMTLTMNVVQKQNSREKTTGPSKAPAPGNPKKQAHKIWQSDQCWIFTCDSLGGSHRAVSNNLERWLRFEAQDKLAASFDRLSPVTYVEAKVPVQPNYSDCGLYLIHFARELLSRPAEIIGFIEKPLPRAQTDKDRHEQEKLEVWKAADTGHLRHEWTEIIETLTAQYLSKLEGRTVEPTKPAENPDSQDFQEILPSGADPPVEVADPSSVGNAAESPAAAIPAAIPPLEATANFPSDEHVAHTVVGNVGPAPHETRDDGDDYDFDDQMSLPDDAGFTDIDPGLDGPSPSNINPDLDYGLMHVVEDVDDILDEGQAMPYTLSTGNSLRPNGIPLLSHYHSEADIESEDGSEPSADGLDANNVVAFPIPELLGLGQPSVSEVDLIDNSPDGDEIMSTGAVSTEERTESTMGSTVGDATEKPSGRRLPASSGAQHSAHVTHINLDRRPSVDGSDIETSPFDGLGHSYQTTAMAIQNATADENDGAPSQITSFTPPLVVTPDVGVCPSAVDDWSAIKQQDLRRTAPTTNGSQASKKPPETVKALKGDTEEPVAVDIPAKPIEVKILTVPPSLSFSPPPSFQLPVVEDTTLSSPPPHNALAEDSTLSAGLRAVAGVRDELTNAFEEGRRSESPDIIDTPSLPMRKQQKTYGGRAMKRKSVSTPINTARSTPSSSKRQKTDPAQSKLDFKPSSSKRKKGRQSVDRSGETHEDAISVDGSDGDFEREEIAAKNDGPRRRRG